MKKWIIGIFAIVSLVGCNTTSDLTETNNASDSGVVSPSQGSVGSLDINPKEIFTDVEDMATLTPIVIVGQVKSESESFDYSQATFFKAEVQIKEIYRDTENALKKGDTITLLQDDIVSVNPLVKKNEKVLLFLKKYKGPVIEDAYRTLGSYQGHFKINKDGDIIVVGDKNEHRVKDANSLSLETLDEVLADTPYVPLETKPMTKEEIEEGNKKEKELEEKHYKEEQNNSP
jgi:molybdopterin converting factor small subunit